MLQKTDYMKIALIFPRYKYPSGDPPIGVGYIASYILEKTKCKVDIIDTTFNNFDAFVIRKIRKNDYDLICFSIMTTMLKDSLRLASLIKKIKPSSKILFAGPHPTVMPTETLKNKQVDAVCIGEGEETILELVKEKFSFKGIKGIWYKHGEEIIKNSPREPIENLDKLPFPLRQKSEIKKYQDLWFQLDSISTNLKGVNIFSSRGCPYKCTYCQPTLESIFGKKIRKRSPKNIVGELKHLKKKYKINAFMFLDDTLIFDKKWVMDICDEIIKSKLNLIWGCNARANLVTEELFKKMRKAGLRKVFMGIESGSQRVLDEVYNKGITLKQVKMATKILKQLGLKIQGYFMIGAPSETEKEIEKTIKFARDLPINEATFSITTPLPKTYLYEKTKDMINKRIEDFDYYKTSVYKQEISEKRLDFLKKKALIMFYLSPKRIIATAKAFLTPTAFKKSLAKLKRF